MSQNVYLVSFTNGKTLEINANNLIHAANKASHYYYTIEEISYLRTEEPAPPTTPTPVELAQLQEMETKGNNTARPSGYVLWCIEQFSINNVQFKIYTDGDLFYLYDIKGTSIYNSTSTDYLKLYATRKVKNTW